MAFEIPILDLSFAAAEDLTADVGKFVMLTASGTVRRPDTASEVALGVLQNAPASGQAAAVRVLGISKCVANAALGVGAYVKPEYVSATDAGKAQDSTTAPAYTRGFVLEAAGAEDDLCSVLLTPGFPAINDAVASIAAVAIEATAGAVTYTAAALIGGLILRDPAGAARSDVSPAAADIFAAIPGAVAGSSFKFTIRNTADAAEVITLTAGSGVTLNGTMTIAQNYSRSFLAVVASSAAVTIYSIGTFTH